MQRDNKTEAKLAMSRALGAAFLSHQVEQLEKSVGRESKASPNRRERTGRIGSGRGGKRGGVPYSGAYLDVSKQERRECSKDPKSAGKSQDSTESDGNREVMKDADTIVVDASVLVHALGQLKKWCKEGRQEVILIPLEALNTLDLLKKGSTPLAQRARAASRILESQVGTNPRIRVQRDDAFVLWDEISFKDLEDFQAPVDSKLGVEMDSPGFAPPPEWLRRTICCGRWETVNALSSDLTSNDLLTSPPTHGSSVPPLSTPSITSTYPSPPMLDNNRHRDCTEVQTRVVLAVTTVTSSTPGTGSSLDTSTVHPGRHERADGSLVRIWAQRAGIEVLDVDPTTIPNSSASHHGQSPLERSRRHMHGADRRGVRESKDGEIEHERERIPSLVEKPLAITLVNEQPVKVLRVLARGEKLDP